MNLLKYSLFILLLCLINTGLQAQEKQQTQSINEGSINDQFEFVIRKSTNWNDENGQAYEVVKRHMLNTLKSHTIDTLNALQARLDNTNEIVNNQQNEINTLKTSLSEIQETLAQTSKEKDSMVLLGKQMSKTSYNLIMWSIIAALLAFLLIFIYRFKNSNVVTQATKNAMADLEKEFKEHRRAALEREQKVRRELQDVINKYEG